MIYLNYLENLFRDRKEREVDLGDFTMKDLINFPYVENVNLEEPYIHEVIHRNHLVIKRKVSKKTADCLHHFQYFPEKKLVIHDTIFHRHAFFMYLTVLMVFPYLFQEDFDVFVFIGMIAAIFFVVTMFLFWAIRYESSEMKRELDIRINYVLRTGTKVNVED